MSFDLEIIDGDLKINSDGKIRTVTDIVKLRQDIIKIITTQLGSSSLYPWYGCAVTDEVIGYSVAHYIKDIQIKASVAESLERLQKLQKSQSFSQKTSLSEMIEAIADVYAEIDVSDPRQINIVVTVLTKDLKKVEEFFTIVS